VAFPGAVVQAALLSELGAEPDERRLAGDGRQQEQDLVFMGGPL